MEVGISSAQQPPTKIIKNPKKYSNINSNINPLKNKFSNNEII